MSANEDEDPQGVSFAWEFFLYQPQNEPPFAPPFPCAWCWRFPLKTLALMWGKSERRVGAYVGEWAGRWGEAGEDLSILDISPAYLNFTLPGSYKQQGLWMICAVPDGKDFMCVVPRSNTMLTRASHSDKVGHC